ncbi:MAG: CARDB domain-containing protein [Candidatus Anstonellales archaeon]
MNHNRFFVFLLVAVFLPFSSVTISGNLNDFEAVRYPDANETFLTDMSYSLSFTVSTDSRVLTSNAEAANLPNEAFVCPGNIRATFSPSLSFARRYLTSVAPLPERCNLPLQYQSQQSGTAQLNNALFETLNSTPYHRLEQDNLGTRTIYTGLANAVLSDSQRNIYYSQRFNEPPSTGAGNAGVLCTGTATIIKDNNERFSFDFPTHPSALFQNLQARSEPYTLGAYVSILDCHGIIAPKCRSQNGQIVDPLQIQKFIYYTDSDAYRLSTERASLRIYVRNPSVAASARIVQINNQPPPQILVIDRGQRIPIEIEISNSQSSEPRKVRITSIATNNNAVSISMDGVPTAWIDVGRSSIFTATLTANAEYTGQIAIVVSLEADGIVCDGSIPRPRLSIPLSVQIIRPLPDLEVEHVSRQPSTPNIGDNITFSVTIKNSGRGRADSSSACLVITTPNGQRLEPLIQNVGPLEENQTTSVRFAYAVQGPQGRTQYSIKADCLNQISESDESNNEISGTFYVLGREQRMPNIRAEDLRLLQEPLVGSEIQMAALLKNERRSVRI